MRAILTGTCSRSELLNAHSATRFTLTLVIDEIQVIPRQRMTIQAMRFLGIFGINSCTAQQINLSRNRLKMAWSNAGPCSAEMIRHQVFRHWLTRLKFIRETRSANALSMRETKFTVTVVRQLAGPDPAWTKIRSAFWNWASFIYKCPKSLLGRLSQTTASTFTRTKLAARLNFPDKWLVTYNTDYSRTIHRLSPQFVDLVRSLFSDATEPSYCISGGAPCLP